VRWVTTSTFRFAFTRSYRLAAAPFGVTPGRALVVVDDEQGMLTARFGPWRLRTPLTNIVGTTPTGPYGLLKTAGPAHLSFADRGLTMATNPHRGLCIEFAEPVPGIEPTGRVRHPALTVTVADIAGLAARLPAGQRRSG
jgi:hypothetical protein